MTTNSNIQMNQDDILQSTRSVVQSLEALKNEHSTMIKTLCDKLDSYKNDAHSKTVVEEEISILKNSDEMVHLGISEATVLMQLSNYLQSIEAEKQKIRSQVKRLCQENAWLRDELAAAQKKLQESEQYSAQIEVELSHLKFLKELKKFDEDLVPARPVLAEGSAHPQQDDSMLGVASNASDSPNSANIGKKSEFPDDDEDQTHNNSTLTRYIIEGQMFVTQITTKNLVFSIRAYIHT